MEKKFTSPRSGAAHTLIDPVAVLGQLTCRRKVPRNVNGLRPK